MNATDALSKIMEEQKLSNAKMASNLGCSNAVIYERLTQENISVKNLVRMLNVLGYEIIAQPKAAGRRPDGCFLIDNSPKAPKEAKEK